MNACDSDSDDDGGDDRANGGGGISKQMKSNSVRCVHFHILKLHSVELESRRLTVHVLDALQYSLVRKVLLIKSVDRIHDVEFGALGLFVGVHERTRPFSPADESEARFFIYQIGLWLDRT